MTLSALPHYFQSKDDLLAQVLRVRARAALARFPDDCVRAGGARAEPTFVGRPSAAHR